MEQDYKTKEEIYSDLNIIDSALDELKSKVDDCKKLEQLIEDFEQSLDSEGINIDLSELESNDLFGDTEELYEAMAAATENLIDELESQYDSLSDSDKRAVPTIFFLNILNDIKDEFENSYEDFDSEYVGKLLDYILSYDERKKEEYKENRKVRRKEKINKRIERDRRIIGLVSEGLTYSQISKELCISTKTIQRTIKRINQEKEIFDLKNKGLYIEDISTKSGININDIQKLLKEDK